jgi:uncharacterized membrane protein
LAAVLTLSILIIPALANEPADRDPVTGLVEDLRITGDYLAVEQVRIHVSSADGWLVPGRTSTIRLDFLYERNSLSMHWPQSDNRSLPLSQELGTLSDPGPGDVRDYLNNNPHYRSYRGYNSWSGNHRIGVRITNYSPNIFNPVSSAGHTNYQRVPSFNTTTRWGHTEIDVLVFANFSGSYIDVDFEIEYYTMHWRWDSVRNTETWQWDRYVETVTVRLPVGSASAVSPTPEPTAAQVSVTPTSFLTAGQQNQLAFQFSNRNGGVITDLQYTVQIGNMNIIAANNTPTLTGSIARIEPNTNISSSVSLSVPVTIPSGDVPFTVIFDYFDENLQRRAQVVTRNVDIPVQNNLAASLQLTNTGGNYSVTPGNTFNAQINIQNLGNLTANNVTLSVVTPSDFALYGVQSRNLGNLAGGTSHPHTVVFRALPGTTVGLKTLTLRLTFTTDANSTPQTLDFPVIFVDVTATPQPALSITRESVPGGILQRGAETTLSLTVQNTGTAAAANVQVVLSGFTGTGLMLPDGENPMRTIASIPAGGSSVVTFRVRLVQGYTQGTVGLSASVSIPGSGAAAVTREISLPVNIPAPPATPQPTPTPPTILPPRFIIEDYSITLDGEPVTELRPGSQFDLTFTLRNTSQQTALRNITLTLSAENTTTGAAFQPAAGSNVFFIDEVPAGAAIERTIRMSVSQSAETRVYALTFAQSFFDRNSAPHTSTENLSLPVIVPMRVELSNFDPPMFGMAGNMHWLTFQIINQGRSTVHNLTVDIEGDFMFPEGSSTYLGNMTSGFIHYFDSMMIFMMPGEIPGAIVLSFEDVSGNINTVRHEFSVSVQEPFRPEWPGDGFDPWNPWEPEPEPGGEGWFGQPWWVVIAGGSGIAAVLIGLITLIVVKSRKGRRLRLRDEDYSDEDY